MLPGKGAQHIHIFRCCHPGHNSRPMIQEDKALPSSLVFITKGYLLAFQVDLAFGRPNPPRQNILKGPKPIPASAGDAKYLTLVQDKGDSVQILAIGTVCLQILHI